MRLRALAACGLLVLGGTVGPAATPDAPGIGVQDANGEVWTIDRHSPARLWRYNGTDWNLHPLATLLPHLPEGAQPRVLIPLADGGMAALLSEGGKTFFYTRLSAPHGKRDEGTGFGVAVELLLEVSSHRPPVILADSKNRLWCSIGPDLYRVTPEGEVSVVYSLKPEEVFLASKGGSKDAHQRHNPLHGVEDRAGRLWFWSEGYSNSLSLDGFLRVEDGKATRVGFSELEKPLRWASLHPREDGTLFLRDFNHGVFILQPETMQLTPFPGPDGMPFLKVSQILRTNDAWWFIANRDADTTARESTLWEWHGGQWRERLPRGHGFPMRTQREVRFLPVSNGLLCLFDDENPWFLGNGSAEPHRLGWETGLPLHRPKAFFRLKDGTFLGWDNQNDPFRGPLLLPPRRKPVAGVTVQERINTRVPTLPEMDWWTIRDDRRHLYHGNHGQPEKIALPAEAPEVHRFTLAPEENGRLWLLPRKRDEPVLIYTPATRQWQTHANLPEAVVAHRSDPPFFQPLEEKRLVPAFSADGKRAVFQDGYKVIHYFDGNVWRQWKAKDLGAFYIGYPFFDADDRLCSLVMNEIYVYEPETDRWTRGEEPGENGPRREWNPHGGSLPQSLTADRPSTWAWDEDGTLWMVRRRELYRFRPNLEPVPVFPEGSAHPFREFAFWLGLRRDAAGNRVFGRDDFITLAPEAFPKVAATRFERSGNRLRLHHPDAVDLQWRLDGGPWRPYPADGIDLAPFPAGVFLVEAQAFTARLDAEFPPARYSLQIVAPALSPPSAPPPDAAPIQPLLTALADSDYGKRKEAIAALARQPAAARPALLKARATAGDDLRWWIDAALEELPQ